MKLNTFMLASIAISTLALGSCQNNNIDEEHHYDNRVFVTSKQVQDDLLIKEEASESSRSISFRLAKPAEKELKITFDAAPQLTAAYNLAYNDQTQALPAENYEIPVKSTVIKTGDISSEDIQIYFKETNKLNREQRYVLPVTITNSDIEVLDSKKTVFFIFKGAALINVVANINKTYFPVKWKQSMYSLNTVTIEALVRVKDWADGREGNAISTVFGVEDYFLIRIGDADRPSNQIQVVTPNGNFPGPNVVPGLPVNEWVHIAVVYNSESHERILYINGKKVYTDESATYSANLETGAGCFIGKSYDNNRWLPGEISEVRVWTIHRTDEEIANNPYKVDPHTPGLAAYWKFNEGAGKTIKDHTGNGNDITGVNDPTWVNVELPAIE